MSAGTNTNVMIAAAALLALSDAWAIHSLITGESAGAAIVFLVVAAIGVIAALDTLRMR